MKKIIYGILGTALLLSTNVVQADDSVIPEMLMLFQQQGATEDFLPSRGEKLWGKVVVSKKGDKRECSSCHHNDLTKNGEHKKSGKVIKPMSPKVNPKRFTKVKKVKKWFKRNCKWTWGRECTPQEKGDILVFLQQQ